MAATESGGRAQILASHASGNSCWHFNHNGGFPAGHRRWLCLCRASCLSRVHLAWACPCAADLRASHHLPTNRAEERLFARAVAEFPPATPSLDLQGFGEELRDGVAELLRRDCGEPLYAATDGSARLNIAALSVVLCQGRGTSMLFAAGTGGEDQSSFKAELLALLWIARACASQPLRERPRSLFRLFAEASRRGLVCTVLWVPSHGKHKQLLLQT